MSPRQTIPAGLLAAVSLHPAPVLEALPTNHGCQQPVLSVVSHQLHIQGPNPKWMYPCVSCGKIHLSHIEFPVLQTAVNDCNYPLVRSFAPYPLVFLIYFKEAKLGYVCMALLLPFFHHLHHLLSQHPNPLPRISVPSQLTISSWCRSRQFLQLFVLI